MAYDDEDVWTEEPEVEEQPAPEPYVPPEPEPEPEPYVPPEPEPEPEPEPPPTAAKKRVYYDDGEEAPPLAPEAQAEPPLKQYASYGTDTMTDAAPEPAPAPAPTEPAAKQRRIYHDTGEEVPEATAVAAEGGKKREYYEKPEGAWATFGRELLHGAPAAVTGAVAGAGTGAALGAAGFNPVTVFGGALIGGVAGGITADVAKDKAVKAAGIEDDALRRANERENPWAYRAGSFLSQAFGGSAKAKAVERVLSGGIAGGWEAGSQLYQGKPLNWSDIGTQAAGGAFWAGNARPWIRGAERAGARVGAPYAPTPETPQPVIPGTPPADVAAPVPPQQGALPFGPETPVPYNPKVGGRQDAQIGGGETQLGLPLDQPAPPPGRPGVSAQPELALEPPTTITPEGQYGFGINAPHPASTYTPPSMPAGAGTAREATPPPTGDPRLTSDRRYAKEPDPQPHSAVVRGFGAQAEQGGPPRDGINVLQPGQVDTTVRHAMAYPAPARTIFEPPRPPGPGPEPGPAPLPRDRSLAIRPPDTTQGVTEPPVPTGSTRMYQGPGMPPNAFTTNRQAAEQGGPARYVDVRNQQDMPFFTPGRDGTFTTRNEGFGQRTRPVQEIRTPTGRPEPPATPPPAAPAAPGGPPPQAPAGGKPPTGAGMAPPGLGPKAAVPPIPAVTAAQVVAAGQPAVPPKAAAAIATSKAAAGAPTPGQTATTWKNLPAEPPKPATPQPSILSTRPPSDYRGPLRADISAADYTKRMSEMRNGKPRPPEKLWKDISKAPPEQVAAARRAIKAWDAEYRAVAKNQKAALARDNAAFQAKQKATISQPGEVVLMSRYGVDIKGTSLGTSTFREALTKHGHREGLLGELTPFVRETLFRMVGKMPVHIMSDNDIARADPRAKGSVAYYNKQQNHIVINEKYINDKKNLANAVLHEGIHAATAHAISSKPEIKATINAIMKDVVSKNLAKIETGGHKLTYGFKNEREFIAEAFSNPVFQKLLADHQISPAIAKPLQDIFGKVTPIKSAWDAIVATVRHVLGVPPGKLNALEAAMRATEWSIAKNEAAKAAFMGNWKLKPADYTEPMAGKGEDLKATRPDWNSETKQYVVWERQPNGTLVQHSYAATREGRDAAWAFHDKANAGEVGPKTYQELSNLIEPMAAAPTSPGRVRTYGPGGAKIYTGKTVADAAAAARADGIKPSDIYNMDMTKYKPAQAAVPAAVAPPTATKTGGPPSGGAPPKGPSAPAAGAAAAATPSAATATPATTLKGAHQSIRSQIAGKPPWYSRIPTTKEEAKAKWREFYTATKNALDPIEQIKKRYAAEAASLSPTEDFAMLARLTKGLGGRFRQMIENGTYDINTGTVNGKSLNEVIKPIADNPDEFANYAVSKRAIELEGRGIKTGMNMPDARRIVAEEGHRFEPVLRDLVGFQDRVLQNLVRSGVLSQDAAAKMRQMNKEYVPFYRALDPKSELGIQLGAGLQTRNPIFRIKGSDKEVFDPIDSIIKNTYVFTDLAHRNQALVKMRDFNNSLPEARQFMKRDRSSHPIEVKESELQRWMDKHGIEGFADETLTIFRPNAFRPDNETIRLFHNGKAEIYKVDENIAKAVNAMDQQSLDLWVKIAATPARMLRAGAVLSPEFMLRNPLRDMETAFIQAKHGSIPFVDQAIGLKHIFTKSNDYQEWLIGGGANANLVSLDRAIVSTDPLSIKGVANVIKDPRQWLEPLRKLSELSEDATRVGMYMRARKKGVHQLEAAYEAREGTLDFSRVGSHGAMRAANSMIPFLNVHLEGLDRAARAFRDKPLDTLAKVSVGITLPSVLLWFRNKDDERVQQLPAWQRDLFWIVTTDDWKPISTAERDRLFASMEKQVGRLDVNNLKNTFRKGADGKWEYNNGTIYRIPKPFELGVLFGSVPERILDAYFTEKPGAFKSLDKTVMRAMIPSYVPQAVLPVAEQWANRSLFLDRNLLTEQQIKLPPAQQYGPHTSETAKKIGDIVRSVAGDKSSFGSPIIIDNYLRQWTGGLGKHVTDMIDAGIKTQQDRAPEPTSSPADWPGYKAFVARFPDRGAQAIQDFYDHRNDRKMEQAGIKELTKTDPKAADTRIRAAGGEAYVGNDFAKLLKADRDTVTQIMQDKKMSPDDKRAAIDLTYLLMIEHAKQGVKLMEQTKRKPAP